MKQALILLMALCLLTGCTAPSAEGTPPAETASPVEAISGDDVFTARELSGTWDARGAVSIVGQGATAAISGSGAQLSDGAIRITAEGVYLLSGEFANLPVVINVDDKEKVQLVLQNASFTQEDSPAILAQEADKVFITLPEGTHSTLTDGAQRTAAYDEAGADAVIFSRADLCINGSGSLTVNGSYKHGVASKDDLVIVSSTLNITSVGTALDGKDAVKVTGATIAVTAGTNGIRSDNVEDAERGYVFIRDSQLDIVSEGDGIQAATTLQMQGGCVTITAGGGSGVKLRNSDSSWKGLKSSGDMLLSSGTYVIASRDDCIHSNSNILIEGGEYELSSSDDGIHADTELNITGGNILITKSYEGLEASKLVISGGNINVSATDDGMNAAGGADGSASADRAGRGMFSNGVGEIIINGGFIVLDAAGDGIDSNANITVTGGVTLVSGPTSGMNSAFDFDGTAKVTGGVLIAAGPSSMAQGFSEAENQGAMLLSFTKQSAGVSLALVDENDNVVVSFTPEKVYQTVVITAPGIVKGGRYTLMAGGTVEGADENGFAQNATLSGGSSLASVTMDSLVYGSSSGFGGSPGGGGGDGFGGSPGGGGGGRGW